MTNMIFTGVGNGKKNNKALIFKRWVYYGLYSVAEPAAQCGAGPYRRFKAMPRSAG